MSFSLAPGNPFFRNAQNALYVRGFLGNCYFSILFISFFMLLSFFIFFNPHKHEERISTSLIKMLVGLRIYPVLCVGVRPTPPKGPGYDIKRHMIVR